MCATRPNEPETHLPDLPGSTMWPPGKSQLLFLQVDHHGRKLQAAVRAASSRHSAESGPGG